MQTIESVQDEIVNEFALFGDWQEKYAHLIEMGRELDPMPPEHKTEDRKVKGCQSQVWLWAERGEEGRMCFEAESDALIVQGLIAILLRVYQGRTPEQVLDTNLDFLEDIGLLSHLSMNRTNGLHSMIGAIRAHAAAAA